MRTLISVTFGSESSFSQPEPSGSSRTGRPHICTPELIAQIAGHIRTDGLSDSAAGLLSGVSKSTLSRWKQEDEALEVAFGQARALFQMERARNIREAVKCDGTLDWRAQAWLLQFSDPEVYGTPSRRRLARAERELREARERQEAAEATESDTDPDEAETEAAPCDHEEQTTNVTNSPGTPRTAAQPVAKASSRPLVVTPADLRKLQEARQQWLSKNLPAPDPQQNVQIRPESPSSTTADRRVPPST